MPAVEESLNNQLISDLEIHAPRLIEKLVAGEYREASEVIRSISEVREQSLYCELGKLTRALHDAIVNFHIDAGIEALKVDGKESDIKDATERLDYVIAATQRAAERTMDLVDDGIPIALKFREEAELIQKDWSRLAKHEVDGKEFRKLYKKVESFLELSVSSASRLNDDFNEILLAQDYQDLTGQVIQKVTKLVHKVEHSLVSLVKMAGEVEEISGVGNSVEDISRSRVVVAADEDIEAEGPIINAKERNDVCNGQDDVDDLLSSLGF